MLWAAETPLTAAQVQQALPDSLAYTTVLTILSRLYTKGQLTRERAGPAFAYRPLVSEDAVAARQFSELLRDGTDRRAVLRGFVQAISDADAAVLKELLDTHDQSSRQAHR